jgi:hypothetical protein
MSPSQIKEIPMKYILSVLFFLFTINLLFNLGYSVSVVKTHFYLENSFQLEVGNLYFLCMTEILTIARINLHYFHWFVSLKIAVIYSFFFTEELVKYKDFSQMFRSNMVAIVKEISIRKLTSWEVQLLVHLIIYMFTIHVD